MDRRFYLDLAASGLRMPIGVDLVLHEQPDPEAVMLDGRALGKVIETAALRYRTPLAIPPEAAATIRRKVDLMLEAS